MKHLIACLLAVAFFSCSQPKAEIVAISEDMIIDESGSGVFMNWFDEQDLNGTPKTRWDTYGMVSYWPAGLVIDLQRKYRIESIWIFDAEGSHRVKGGRLKVSRGEPFDWKDSLSVDMKNAGKWIKLDYSYETRFLQIQKHSTIPHIAEGYFTENYDLAVNEVVIMGYPLEDMPPEKAKLEFVSFNVPMDQFIGMNSYITTPDKVHEAVGSVREYRPWGRNGVTDLTEPISWDPIHDIWDSEYHPTDGNSDNYYQKMLDMGIECMPCIHVHVDEKNCRECIPNFGGDPSDPASYKIMADYSFQFVARYGHTKVPDNMLRTTEAAPKKSGMGLIRYFENWNEGNRWWDDPAGHFTPYQFAAFSSASYDGHMGTLGPGFGVKGADPNIRYSLGGFAELALSYVQAMKLWSDYYRNGSFPAEVINVHHYCNTMGKQHSKEEAHGISPEEDRLKEKLEKMVKWRNENLPDIELWLTEFGWDTADEDTYISAAWGHKQYPNGITMEEIQAQWLIRTYLIGSAAGFERLQMFLANDLRDYKGVYGKSGFITIDDEYKPSWYYTKTLKTALTGMLFHDEYTSGNDNVWIYRYRHPETEKGAYVLWCPTADGTTANGYKLKLTGNASSATQVSLVDKMDFGKNENLDIESQSLTLNVSERPIIILVDKI